MASVNVANGKANGVTLEDGTEIRAKSVLSNATPKVTYLNLLHPVRIEFIASWHKIEIRSNQISE